jgi:hypothetical protein
MDALLMDNAHQGVCLPLIVLANGHYHSEYVYSWVIPGFVVVQWFVFSGGGVNTGKLQQERDSANSQASKA